MAKNGWYYAAKDVGGAYTFGTAGSALGPMGTSLGIVIGGFGTSAWAWYWDQPRVIVLPDEEFTRKYDGIYEQAGYLHNELLFEFVNENLRKFDDTAEFVDALYKPTVLKLSESYAMPIEEVEKIFDKNKLVRDLNKFEATFNDLDDETHINNLVSIVQENYKDDKIPEYLRGLLIETNKEKDNKEFNVERFFNQKISEMKNDKRFDQYEKEINLNSLNIFKYSLALWNKNMSIYE